MSSEAAGYFAADSTTLVSSGVGMAIDRFWQFHEGDGHTDPTATTDRRQLQSSAPRSGGTCWHTRVTCPRPNGSDHPVESVQIQHHA